MDTAPALRPRERNRQPPNKKSRSKKTKTSRDESTALQSNASPKAIRGEARTQRVRGCGSTRNTKPLINVAANRDAATKPVSH
jgi:hypothetical protein